MSVLPLIPTNFPGRWEEMSSSYPPYKLDRPSYCTPAPVENTPANNACRMIDLRGIKVASFSLGEDQYICLPQAFEYFLKHLVGGLHTVYTKLKRLNITPVVCNVEQVRILRGLGAIQPGVNRCKLITKKDFEILFRDCINARYLELIDFDYEKAAFRVRRTYHSSIYLISRPGRPPKRYPLLSQSSDVTSRQNCTSNFMLDHATVTSPHKKMRLSVDSITEEDKQDSDKTTKEAENFLPQVSLPLRSPRTDLQNNQNSQLAYLQQTMRQQYQNAMALSGLQSGLDVSQPGVAQLLMMSHPAFFNPGVSSSTLAMLNHFNKQVAQTQQAMDDSFNFSKLESKQKEIEINEEKQIKNENTTQLSEDKQNDARARSSNEIQLLSNELDKQKRRRFLSSTDDKQQVENHAQLQHVNLPSIQCNEKNFSTKSHSDVNRDSGRESDDHSHSDLLRSDPHATSIFLTQIQELLKLAASSANMQEKKSLTEIAKLKEMLLDEMKLREDMQRKLIICKKEKAETEKLLDEVKKDRKKLGFHLFTMQKKLPKNVRNDSDCDKDTSSKSFSPTLKESTSNDARSESSSPPVHTSSLTLSTDAIDLSAAGQGIPSPTSPSSRQSSPININQNNNSVFSDEQSSPDAKKQDLVKSNMTSRNL